MSAYKNKKSQRNCRFSSLAAEYEQALLKLEKQERANAAKDRRAKSATAATTGAMASKQAGSAAALSKAGANLPAADRPTASAPSTAASAPAQCYRRRTASTPCKNAQGKITNLLVAWQKVSPPLMAEHTDSVVYSKRSTNVEVLVYVDDAAFAAELSMNKEIYRIKMQEITGKEIAEVKFLVSRQTSLRKQMQKRRGGFS